MNEPSDIWQSRATALLAVLEAAANLTQGRYEIRDRSQTVVSTHDYEKLRKAVADLQPNLGYEKTGRNTKIQGL